MARQRAHTPSVACKGLKSASRKKLAKTERQQRDATNKALIAKANADTDLLAKGSRTRRATARGHDTADAHRVVLGLSCLERKSGAPQAHHDCTLLIGRALRIILN